MQECRNASQNVVLCCSRLLVVDHQTLCGLLDRRPEVCWLSLHYQQPQRQQDHHCTAKHGLPCSNFDVLSFSAFILASIMAEPVLALLLASLAIWEHVAVLLVFGKTSGGKCLLSIKAEV